MPPGRYTRKRRTPRQTAADARAEQLAGFLGRSLKERRAAIEATQGHASDLAGLAQSAWSELERGRGATMSLRVWVRATSALDAELRAYVENVSGADQPRDAVHLRHQELVARVARGGGWQAILERSLGGPGVADLVLSRASDLALMEVWNWFADVGDAFRSWDRKLERLAADEVGQTSGCWIVRATRRNRELVSAHRTIFAARFPESGAAWLSALTSSTAPMPKRHGLLWVSVKGDRLFAARMRAERT